MFYRIKMNIVDVPLEIGVVSNSVFPESTLPKLILAARVARYGCSGRITIASISKGLSERGTRKACRRRQRFRPGPMSAGLSARQ